MKRRKFMRNSGIFVAGAFLPFSAMAKSGDKATEYEDFDVIVRMHYNTSKSKGKFKLSDRNMVFTFNTSEIGYKSIPEPEYDDDGFYLGKASLIKFDEEKLMKFGERNIIIGLGMLNDWREEEKKQ